MSFLDDLIDFGSDLFSGVSSFVDQNPVITNLARTAATGYVLNKVNQSVNRENDVPEKSRTSIPDPGVRLQVDPDSQHRVPVVYGQAFLGGIITDVQLTNNNLNLYVVFTISEMTGLIMSTNTPSSISFENIFWDDKQIIFKADGITADHTLDRDGNIDYSVQDLVQIRCYSGNSASPVYPTGYSGGALPVAWSVMPGWTANSYMSDLTFVIAKLTYNKDKGITNIPKLTFQLENTLTQPGDVIYDYMINTRYGAGIPLSDIYTGL